MAAFVPSRPTVFVRSVFGRYRNSRLPCNRPQGDGRQGGSGAGGGGGGGGRCTNSRNGPTWYNPKLFHLYCLLNRLTMIMTNTNGIPYST